MKFVSTLLIVAQAIKIKKGESFLCSKIESGEEKLKLSEESKMFEETKKPEEPVGKEGITL
jgi:hypothetical protein